MVKLKVRWPAGVSLEGGSVMVSRTPADSSAGEGEGGGPVAKRDITFTHKAFLHSKAKLNQSQRIQLCVELNLLHAGSRMTFSSSKQNTPWSIEEKSQIRFEGHLTSGISLATRGFLVTTRLQLNSK